MWKKVKNAALISIMFIVYALGNLLVWVIGRFTLMRLVFRIWWHRRKFADLGKDINGYTSTILSAERVHFKPADLIVARHGGVHYMKVLYRPVVAPESDVHDIIYEGYANLYWGDGTIFTTKKPLELIAAPNQKTFRYTLQFNIRSVHANQGAISSCSVNLNAFTFTLK